MTICEATYVVNYRVDGDSPPDRWQPAGIGTLEETLEVVESLLRDGLIIDIRITMRDKPKFSELES